MSKPPKGGWNFSPSPEEAYREISKWLNEEPNQDIDKECLAIILYEYDNMRHSLDLSEADHYNKQIKGD